MSKVHLKITQQDTSQSVYFLHFLFLGMAFHAFSKCKMIGCKAPFILLKYIQKVVLWLKRKEF